MGGNRESLCPQLRTLSTAACCRTSSPLRRKSQGQSSCIPVAEMTSTVLGMRNIICRYTIKRKKGKKHIHSGLKIDFWKADSGIFVMNDAVLWHLEKRLSYTFWLNALSHLLTSGG